jgi:hypothetical protein
VAEHARDDDAPGGIDGQIVRQIARDGEAVLGDDGA